MTVLEFAHRLLYQLTPMVPGLAAAVAATIAAAAVFYLLIRNSWADKKTFGLMGLFFGLGRRERFRMACVWLRLVFVVTFAVRFQALEALHYYMVLLPGILAALTDAGVVKWVENLFWMILQLIGLLAVNMVCRFVQEMSGGTVFLYIYMGAATFLVLFSLFLFISEIGAVSALRSIDPYEVWAEETARTPEERE